MKPIFLSASALLALALANATHAETPVVLDSVEVTARPQSLTIPSLETARVEMALTAGGTEVVDSDRYLKGRASTLADTFALSAGVFAQPRFGSDEARLSIRGSGLQRTYHGRGIRVLQDGVPINFADGAFDMQSLEASAADYINVWRGANALAYGSSTLGGAIDYVSHTGRTAPGGFARLEAGSWGYFRSTLAGGSSQGALDGYASFTEQQQNGFRDHADQENQRLFANAGLRLSQNAETRFYVTAIRADSELPGTLTKTELENDPSQADKSFFGAVRYNNKRDYDLLRVANKTSVQIGDTLVALSAAWTYKDLDHPITPFAGVFDVLTNDLLLGLSATNTSDLFGHDNRVRAGVNFTRGESRNSTYQNVFGARGALTARSEQTSTNTEFFVEDQFTLGRGFTVVLGTTVAHNTRENDQLLGAAASYDRSYDNVSPKVGLRWDGRDVQLYTNVSGSYEPPSAGETGGAVANDAQKAVSVEIGTRGMRGPVRWDASVYAARIDGEFLSLNDAFGAPLGTINADKTTHQGVELAMDIDVLGQSWHDKPDNRLVLRGAWTYGRFKFDDDAVYGNNTLAGIPPHLIRAELMWENAAGWYAGPTVEWVPVKSYVDFDNTLAADPYALLGFKLGRRLEKGISWFIEAKNLFDKDYAATHDVIASAPLGDATRAFYPGDGRGFYAGIEYRF
ncbi:TonB-dependent receptor family protein [Rariglobus hedericola]|uniref:TonB-dependent receptor n=1 Tax=Rariglobus hedericola TaxID=2597822 RepID=A0A556QEG9_9BACT|nr:TonB-dependent receptor [Rariglobus hedericola]TSJ75049.1 TonB-dependent receptor [Rariglobus hedericola]